MIRNLGYLKMCMRWVPRSLTVEHKTKRKAISSSCLHVLKLRERPSYSGLLQQMKPGSIVLGQRLKGNPWNGTILNLPAIKKLKNSPSVGKVMITVFWDYEGVIFVNAMLRGETTPTPTSGFRQNSQSF
jgi:hypothetical protein